MYAAFLEKTQKSIEALKRHLATSDAMRSAIHEKALSCKGIMPCFDASPLSIEVAPDRIEWRIIDHCAAVTRLYAIYEQFAQEMIREHLALLQKHVAFDDLAEDLKSAYRRGFASILEKKEGPRYGHLNLSSLVEQYSNALSGKPYNLEPLALLIQEQNLRLPELTRLFAASGIANINTWVDKHRSVKSFFEQGERLGASSEHELLELIKYRNDAAHGSINIDELPGLDYLYEFCDFISAVCKAISERVQMTGLECLLDRGGALHQGKVNQCIKSDKVLIGEMTGNFTVGDTIYLCGDDYCIEREVVSLQIDGVNHSEVFLEEPTELGLAIDKPGRKKAKIIAIVSAPSTTDEPLPGSDASTASSVLKEQEPAPAS